jgi:hypothetical protein
MSANFAGQLRARPGTIRLPSDEGPRVTIRVQLLEAYDAVRVEAGANAAVVEVKVAALAELDPAAPFHDEFVVKHRGVEILDEALGLAAAGIPDGAIISVSHRRRRPVR